jgi:transposase
MAKPLVSDALWQRIEPLLPPPKPRRFRFPGRKPLDRRKVLTGILFVLKTGIPWEELPQEMGCGSGMSCWNYLHFWQEAGVWRRLHEVLLAELQGADRIDWSRAVVDSTHARALGGGEKTGPNPTDRRKLGTKHHIVTDGQGIPLAVTITGSNRHDVSELLHVVDAIPEVRGKVGRPRQRPDVLLGDRAYHSESHWRALRRRGICPLLARRNQEHGSGLGIFRWVVERTASWLHSFRKLRLRTDRKAGIHEAFVALAASLICMWFL